MKNSQLSVSEARRVALAAQGLARPRQAAKPGWRALAKAVDGMALLQIDSVNVLCRSHYLPVFARAGAYDQTLLDARTHGGRKRHYFEYWAHEASFLPLPLYPLMRWKMDRARRGDGTYAAVHRFGKDEKAYVKRVLNEVRRRGAVTVSDLDDPGERSGHWWGWSKGKYALEYLFDTGDLTASKREGFERHYDLPERVIPGEFLHAAAPRETDAIGALLDLSGAALGVATEYDLRDYFRLPVDDAKAGIAQLVEAGRLKPVAVDGWKNQAYLHCEAQAPRKTGAATLVSPFDPVCWNRPRGERLFDFHYRIEIYTPKHKRRFGYYVLPFLQGDRFTARLCLKADRQNGMLLVNTAHLEDHARAEEVAPALGPHLETMALWLGLGGVAVSAKGNLAEAVRARF